MHIVLYWVNMKLLDVEINDLLIFKLYLLSSLCHVT